MINSFTIRVYGILINPKNEVLLVHEKMSNLEFTKFPGGGLEFYEGTKDCLVREFKEETGLDIKIVKHIYTTDIFVQSTFNPKQQLMAIYYLVEPINQPYDIDLTEKEINFNDKIELLRFFWVNLNALNQNLLTFPIDRLVANQFLLK